MTKEKLEKAKQLSNKISDYTDILDGVNESINDLNSKDYDFHLKIQTKKEKNWSNPITFINEFINPLDILILYRLKIEQELIKLQTEFNEL